FLPTSSLFSRTPCASSRLVPNLLLALPSQPRVRFSTTPSLPSSRHGQGRRRRGRAPLHRRCLLLRRQEGQALRDQEVERRLPLGLGYRRGQLRHLPQPHHGPLHRVPGEPGERHQRGVHRRLGSLQPCIPLPLHQPLAQDPSSVPSRQQRVGVPEVWSLDNLSFGSKSGFKFLVLSISTSDN
uniref:Uncharacterized protein n=1 Tax=Oryza punctata TaxID=4537 RepID=A0A0E0K482_ORYPU